MSAPNRKYKDSVFVDLFSEDEKAKENFFTCQNYRNGNNPLEETLNYSWSSLNAF